MGRFDGKVAIVTGAGRGIGRSHALLLASEGAAVVVNDLGGSSGGDGTDSTPAQEVVDEITAKGGKAVANYDSVSSWDGAQRLIQQAVDELGGLDVLINNAGIAGPTGRVEDISIADWERTIAVDLNSMFYCTRLAVPLLKAAGGGSIINLSSVAGRLGYAMRTPYSSAKWAVVGFTKSLANELGPSNIRVNALQPGLVDGDRIRNVIRAKAKATGVTEAQFEAELLSRVSLRRMVSAQDIANMALFLATTPGANISGQALSICGNVESIV